MTDLTAKAIEDSLQALAQTIPSGPKLLQTDIIKFFGTLRRTIRKQRTFLENRDKEIKFLTEELVNHKRALDKCMGDINARRDP